ncbi:MAG: LamG-like jellyroll fold domain-containing protein [Pseudomonadota bacterium]
MHPMFKLAASAALMLAAPTMAQNQEAPFAPVMATFSGQGALVLPPAQALSINGSGTIEFWVAAQWQNALDYDPAVIAYSGPQGARFAVHIAADRQGLGVYAGQFFQGVQFDFSDGQAHYVALVTIGDSIDVYIDGQFRTTLGYGFADLPAETFSVGSIGNFSPFIGLIGQVRIWDEPIDPDVLNYFSWRPIETQGPNAHPDLDALVGASTFGNPETSGFVFVGDGDPINTTLPPEPFDDSDIDLPGQ